MKILFLFFFILTTNCLFAQTDSLQTRQDSVFTNSGDTLVGRISIDKDNNQYLFKSPTTDSLTLLPKKVKRFTYYSTDTDGERQVYDAIFDKFYLLELGENEIITLYATYSYTKITDDGPIYYTTKKKYCLTKNKILYNLRPESLQADFIILTADCSKVVKKIKEKKVAFENLAAFVNEYNHCSSEKK